jgi:hypothetical protein
MGNMPPISAPTDGLPGSVQDHEATLIDTTHGHTVLSPNAVWVRRPRKSNTPLRSPDGIERFAEEENLGTPSKVRGNEESAGEGAQTPMANIRRGVPVDSAGAGVSGDEKKMKEKKERKSAEPGRRSARRSARNSVGPGQRVDFTVASDAAPGPSSRGDGDAQADMHAAEEIGRESGPAVPAGEPDGQAKALQEGEPKRRRRKSTKLQSDEFVVEAEETSPILSREEQGTDDDEFVPGGLRAAAKAVKAARGHVREEKYTLNGSAGRQRDMDGARIGNASLNQTRTPPTSVMRQQQRADETATRQTVGTPSMNLFHHFQETQKPSSSDLDGDIQKVLEENIQAEADLKDISDLMAEIAKVSENTRAWEEMLESKSNILEKLRVQNGTLKELFAGLGLSKNNLPDFSMKDVESDEGRNKRMLSFGRRLVSLLRHGKRPKDGDFGDGIEPSGAAVTLADMAGSVDSVPVGEAKDTNVAEDSSVRELDAEVKRAAAGVQEGGETPSANKVAAGNDTHGLEERFHPIAAQVAGAGLQAAKGDPARAVMYLINKGFQARQADGFEGDPPPEFCSVGVAGEDDKGERIEREETHEAQRA